MLILTEPATATLITLADLKAHLNIIGSQDDDRLTQTLAAATSVIEYETRICFVEQTWEQHFTWNEIRGASRFPQWYLPTQTKIDPYGFYLKKYPVTEVAISYWDTTDTLVDWTGDFELVNEHNINAVVLNPTEILPAFSINKNYPLVITCTCGGEDVPPMAQQLCRLVCGRWNENRGDKEMPKDSGCERLTNLLKRYY